MICVECKREFTPTARNMDTCISCLLRPSHTLKDILMKNCKGCQKPFEPSSPNSQYCASCSIARKTAHAEMQQAGLTPLPEPPSKALGEEGINKLIQAGATCRIPITYPGDSYVKPPWVAPTDLAEKLALYHRLKAELKAELTKMLEDL